jgi:hypothetical protein
MVLFIEITKYPREINVSARDGNVKNRMPLFIIQISIIKMDEAIFFARLIIF